MKGTHAEQQIVTDGTSEYLWEMVAPDVGTSIDSGGMLFFAVSPSAWINPPCLPCLWNGWTKVPWEYLQRNKRTRMKSNLNYSGIVAN